MPQRALICYNMDMPYVGVDRRSFLKVAALAPSLSTGELRGANGRVQLAFIGTGRQGRANIGFAAAASGFAIAAVCDIDRPARDAALAQACQLGFHRVRPVEDFQEILADRSIDAVSIAVPDRSRAAMAVAACKAGKDVRIEAPVCVSVEEGIELVEASRKYRRILQGGTVLRSGLSFRKTRDIVRSGSLGNIAYCRAWDDGGRGVDLIDIVQFVFDEAMPTSVAAPRGAFAALGTWHYPGFVAAYETGARNRGIALYGTKGTLSADHTGYSVFPNGVGTGSTGESREEWGEMHIRHWNNFREAIHSRRRPVSDIESGVRSTIAWLSAGVARNEG